MTAKARERRSEQSLARPGCARVGVDRPNVSPVDVHPRVALVRSRRPDPRDAGSREREGHDGVSLRRLPRTDPGTGHPSGDASLGVPGEHRRFLEDPGVERAAPRRDEPVSGAGRGGRRHERDREGGDPEDHDADRSQSRARRRRGRGAPALARQSGASYSRTWWWLRSATRLTQSPVALRPRLATGVLFSWRLAELWRSARANLRRNRRLRLAIRPGYRPWVLGPSAKGLRAPRANAFCYRLRARARELGRVHRRCRAASSADRTPRHPRVPGLDLQPGTEPEPALGRAWALLPGVVNRAGWPRRWPRRPLQQPRTRRPHDFIAWARPVAPSHSPGPTLGHSNSSL